MQFVDAHVHLLGKKIFSQWDVLSNHWVELAVTSIVHMSSTLIESEKALNLFKEEKNIFIGVGKHPWKIKNVNEHEQTKFEDLIANPHCKVIGEVGLDYYAIKKTDRYEYQKEWFKFFIEMCNKYKKPLNIHVTGAEHDIYKFLVKYWNKKANVNVHWYSGSSDIFDGLVDLGCFFSINPAVYYSKNHIEIVTKIPEDRILTESDGDVFYKPINQLGEPSIIPKVIDRICEINNFDKIEICNNILLNFENYLHK